MKVLVLGGTVFVGRAIVEAALEAGHTPTLVNRGLTNPDLFPQVEKIHAAREQVAEQTAGRTWDRVIDVSGYLPGQVSQAAQALSRRVGHYTFISTLSVYAGPAKPGTDEEGRLAKWDPSQPEVLTSDSYGPLKVGCEQAVRQHFRNNHLIVRPGIVAGPNDPTDRFTYWPWRVAQGGEVLVPGRPERGIQYIDARDLAEWVVRLSAVGETGIYNAVSPGGEYSMGHLLDACLKASRSQAQLTWVEDEFLVRAGVEAGSELPFWLPESDPDSPGSMQFKAWRAETRGIALRPMIETVRDTLEWAQRRPKGYAWQAGLEPSKEARLLAAWKKESAQRVR